MRFEQAVENLQARELSLSQRRWFILLIFSTNVNRPFYRHGGHIESIRFKEYYRMPRGQEHISFVFSSAFRDIVSYSFLRIRL